MPDTEPDESEEPEEKGEPEEKEGPEKKGRPEEKRWKKSGGTTLSRERWFEVLNKHDPLEQYAKKRKQKKSSEGKREESGKERREEPGEGTSGKIR